VAAVIAGRPEQVLHVGMTMMRIRSCPADEPLDRLRAGEALSAGRLTAAGHGVSVPPHSAPVEITATAERCQP
jgi:hypothetical protein